MVNIPLFIGFHTSEVVQDFFHQQYCENCFFQKGFSMISFLSLLLSLSSYPSTYHFQRETDNVHSPSTSAYLHVTMARTTTQQRKKSDENWVLPRNLKQSLPQKCFLKKQVHHQLISSQCESMPWSISMKASSLFRKRSRFHTSQGFLKEMNI